MPDSLLLRPRKLRCRFRLQPAHESFWFESCVQGCQQVKNILTAKKGGRLEKLIEGTFGSTTEEVETKQVSKESCMESKNSLMQRKKKSINPHTKGGSDCPVQCANNDFSKDVDESVRKRPIKYKAVQVNISTEILRQPPVVTQLPKLPAPSEIPADGKFQDITVLACERLRYRACLKSAASQHCQQQSQRSVCISELSALACDNVHRNKILSVRESESAKADGIQSPSKQLESNVENSVWNAMHLKVMDSTSNAGLAQEAQPISLVHKDCSETVLSSKISVAKSIIMELDGQGSIPDMHQSEVGCPVENGGAKVYKGHAGKKKLRKHKRKAGSLCAQAVQHAPGPTVNCKKTSDVSKVLNVEHAKKSSLSFVRIKVKGPQMQEPYSCKVTVDKHILKDSAQNLMLPTAEAKSLLSSALDEQSSRNRTALEEQCLKDNSAQVDRRDPGSLKICHSATVQHIEAETGKSFCEEAQASQEGHFRSSTMVAETNSLSELASLGIGASKTTCIHLEQQKTGRLDADLHSDDSHALPPKGGEGVDCEIVSALSSDVVKQVNQIKHAPCAAAVSLGGIEVHDNDQKEEAGHAREPPGSADQPFKEVCPCYLGSIFSFMQNLILKSNSIILCLNFFPFQKLSIVMFLWDCSRYPLVLRKIRLRDG